MACYFVTPWTFLLSIYLLYQLIVYTNVQFNKFKYIMISKDYDLNSLCISLGFEPCNERTLLVNVTSNIV